MVMSCSNIETFNEITGRIFARLYEKFPVPQFVDAEHLIEGGKDAVLKWNDAGFQELTPEAKFALATIGWLGDAGYLSHKSIYETCYADVVLTPQGLVLLNALPVSLESSERSEPIGSRLVSAMKAGAGQALRSIANQVLTEGVSMGITRAIQHVS